MKRFAVIPAVWLLLGLLPAQGPAPGEGWIILHDGESHYGWTPSGTAWSAGRGILAADGGSAGTLRSNTPFTDFVLHFEIRAEKSAGGALYVRAARDGNPKDTGWGVDFSSLASTTWVPVEIEALGAGVGVRASGRMVDHSSAPVAPAGFFVLEARPGGRVEIRNMRLRLLKSDSLFNGNDLSGWKSTGEPAKQKGGLSRLFGGGKPKEAKWTVVRGMIHGADGPGQLESLLQFGDFILQADVRINSRRADQRRRYAILFRGDPGQLGTGYEVNIQPGATGALMGLTTARKNLGAANQFITLTVAAHGRHVQIWTDGIPVTDFNDVRPEGADPKKAARSTPGVIAFYTPEDDADVDIRNVRAVQLPKTFGLGPKKTEISALPQAPTAPSLPAMPAPQAPAGHDAGAAALQQQLQQQQMAQMKQEQRTQQEAQLLQQALRTTDPAQQVAIFDQILALNPNNQVAFNGRKEAVAKLEEQQRKEAEKAAASSQQEQAEQEKQMTLAQSIQSAEAAFLAGNLLAAEQALNAAERIAPDNPQVQALRSRLNYANQRRSSILALGAAGLGTGCIALLAWIFAARRRRDPYIEVVSGLDKGKRFNIDKEVVMVGAIPEDGGTKNDVVLRDAERMISRFHAQFHYKEGKLYIVDTNSYNGTFVDKKRLEPGKPVPLKSGSRVTFAGTCTIKVGFERRKQKKK
ncbi:MAG: family 16 glycoside hydrolase [Acidobacteriota bacterium]